MPNPGVAILKFLFCGRVAAWQSGHVATNKMEGILTKNNGWGSLQNLESLVLTRNKASYPEQMY